MRALREAIVASVTAIGFTAAAPVAAQTQQKYPTKPVRIVVGFSPGSATDITARIIGPKLSETWGQPVIIENRSGAGSTLASAMVAKATPDGHTLLMVSAAFAITAVLQKNLPYDALKDFSGVAQIGASTSALTVAPALGVKSVKELIALAQERPDKILFGSAGTGSGVHMTTERFNLLAGIKVVHVPFRGQPEMLIDILGGRIQYGIPGLGPAMPFIREGRLLPLAVVNPRRSPLLPNVPAMVEILPGFERDAAHALVAPARTPRPILNQISNDVARVLELPEVKERMQAIAFEPAPTAPEEYDRIIRNQMEIFTRVAKAAGLIPK
ncbi:MAG TPA: tripartite tricarboxylate transporter substrate binding protein [Burkholderiales bacterium]|jgi:tripartite-type tricarboxylate transporter receptor subunit TctC|nr:tripartite tricarboxylate transporter substrate binding protein [Burkholderiales bacterium]